MARSPLTLHNADECFFFFLRPCFLAPQAGVSGLWYKYVGLDGKVVGVDKFGMSAPGDIVFEEYGMTAANLISECKSYM